MSNPTLQSFLDISGNGRNVQQQRSMHEERVQAAAHLALEEDLDENETFSPIAVPPSAPLSGPPVAEKAPAQATEVELAPTGDKTE